VFWDEETGGKCCSLSKNIDQVDEKILAILRDDSRRPFVEIAKTVNLSEAAIRRRVGNLIKQGVISKFTIETSIGPQANAISLLSVNPSFPTSDVSARLKKVGGVDSIYEITGEYDVAVVVSGSNIAEINSTIDEIRKLSGIDDTNTVVVLKVVR
jgi:Lrp/AsnC family transcriptional regulator, regulator for asnA, asnC and gidA